MPPLPRSAAPYQQLQYAQQTATAVYNNNFQFAATTSVATNQPVYFLTDGATGDGDYGSDEAKQRARKLLLDHLTEDQREEFERDGRFTITVERPDGSRARYRLGGGNGIFRIGDDDALLATFCCHPPVGYPRGDVALTQKLMIETDEREFLRLANFQSGMAEIAREAAEIKATVVAA